MEEVTRIPTHNKGLLYPMKWSGNTCFPFNKSPNLILTSDPEENITHNTRTLSRNTTWRQNSTRPNSRYHKLLHLNHSVYVTQEQKPTAITYGDFTAKSPTLWLLLQNATQNIKQLWILLPSQCSGVATSSQSVCSVIVLVWCSVLVMWNKFTDK